jgi:hypothetical protein
VRAEHENELIVLFEHERFIRESEKRRWDRTESLEMMVIEYRRKSTEDEPRCVFFKHGQIGKNSKRIGSSMGHLKDSERIRLKGYTTKIRLGPTTTRIK